MDQKVNVIAKLEFELVYFEAVIQHYNHYITDTFPGFYLRYWEVFLLAFQSYPNYILDN